MKKGYDLGDKELNELAEFMHQSVYDCIAGMLSAGLLKFPHVRESHVIRMLLFQLERHVQRGCNAIGHDEYAALQDIVVKAEAGEDP